MAALLIAGFDAAGAAYLPAMSRVAPSMQLGAAAPRVGRIGMDTGGSPIELCTQEALSARHVSCESR